MREGKERSVRRMFVVISCYVSVVSSSFGQVPVFPERNEVPAIVSFFAPIVFPKVIQDGYALKEYIRSEEFTTFRATYGDLYAVDAIFDRAMRVSWNNIYEALFISLVATMDHSKFGVRVPLFGPLIWVPLTSESAEEFRQRIAALPRRLYPDSPSDATGDRDKLQHFFGSAFLTYVFESREAAERIGEFIEWGEDKVIVDGALDERDFRANRHGQDFGLMLLDEPDVLPSSFFHFAIAQTDSIMRLPVIELPLEEK